MNWRWRTFIQKQAIVYRKQIEPKENLLGLCKLSLEILNRVTQHFLYTLDLPPLTTEPDLKRTRKTETNEYVQKVRKNGTLIWLASGVFQKSQPTDYDVKINYLVHAAQEVHDDLGGGVGHLCRQKL